MSRRASTRRASNKKPQKKAIPKSLLIAPSAWGVANGYGRVAVAVAAALQRAGIKISVIGAPRLSGEGPEIPRIDKIDSPIVLHIGEPPTWKPIAHKRNIGLCWWPFSKIPDDWYRSLYNVEDLIVPSTWDASGTQLPKPNGKISVVPLGVDCDTFKAVQRERGDLLRILFFDSRADEYRAGAEVAISAFLRAFPEKRQDVRLDIWTTQPANLLMPDSRVQLRRHIGSDADLVRLYTRYDALLSTARGSGFGLVPIEAMATGMPVFHSGKGGYEAFEDLGVLVASHHRPVVRTAHANADCFEMLYETLAAKLQQLDQNYDEFQADAQLDAEAVRRRFTWDATARGLLHALEGNDAANQSGDVSQRQSVQGAA